MTVVRTFSVLSLAFATLFLNAPSAEANDIKDFFRSLQHGRVDIKFGKPHLGDAYGKLPGPRHGYFPGKPCYTKPYCPPPQPVHCVYCVYYLDCHGHWLYYGKFHSRWAAKSAANKLHYHGYRTSIKVKHLGHAGGYPPAPPF